ncbi:hypothetical protein [Sphaerisporangium rufum]|nr:hypothetical protein [Sphaerisporangium rufum]
MGNGPAPTAGDPRATGHDPDDHYRRRYEGVREFLRVFDQMRIRPTRREGDLPVPVLWLTGSDQATTTAADALEARCDGTPFARIGPVPDPGDAPFAPLVAELRHVAGELAATAPTGEPRLRFPLFQQTVWMLDLQLTETEREQLHDAAKRAIRRRRRQVTGGTGQDRRTFWANVRAYAEGPLPAWAAATALLSAGWADQLTALFGVTAIASGLVIGSVHVLLLSRSWAGRGRYRWFCRQPYLMPGQPRNRPRDIAAFTVRVLQARRRAAAPRPAPGAPHEPATDPAGVHRENTDRKDADRNSTDRKAAEAAQAVAGIEHLLVHAFLEDLRQGYERRWWKVWRRVAWARTSYPVLLVDGRDGRLAALIEEVRAAVRRADPLMVVVAGRQDRPPLPPGVPAGRGALTGRPEASEELWARWVAELGRDRALGSCRVLRVELDDADVSILEKITVPVRGRRRPLLAHPSLPWAVVATLVCLSLVRVLADETGRCAPGIRRMESGECVGISDGGFAFAPQMSRVLAEIQRQNRRILDGGHPYVTVVYLGKLTRPAGAADNDAMTDIHGELAGLAVEQRRLLGIADGSQLQMRVLVANAGNDFQYAPEVAEDVLAMIATDPTVIGVVGLGESKEKVRQAIRVLARRAVPVITTTSTYDDLGRHENRAVIRSFFPLAPPNSELAATAARWAKEGRPDRGIRPARNAMVFTDTRPGDLLGRDLGARFVKAFNAGAGPGVTADFVEFSGGAALGEKVTEVCGRRVRPDLVYYTGRSPQFGAFVAALGKSQCDHVTIMANDDVTQYVNDHATELGRNARVRVTYVALSSPAAWHDVPAQHRTDFYGQLDDLLGSLDMRRLPAVELPSRDYAVQAQDAADALMRAAQAAFADQGARSADPGRPGMVDRGGVLLALANLPASNGDSGLVKLHGATDGLHALDRPIMLVTVDERGEPVVVRQCGRLYADQATGSTC